MATGFLRLYPHLALGEFQPADDDRQHIVEVMGDAASQLAHGIHFLHLPQMLFGRFALGRFLLQPFIGFGQFGGARADGGVEPVGALALRFGETARIAPVGQRIVGEPGGKEDADEQGKAQQAGRAAHRLGAVACQRHRQAAFAQAGIFGLDDDVEQGGDTLEVTRTAGLMKAAERADLLPIGRAQGDFVQRLGAVVKGPLQRLHIAALPAAVARGIVQRLELAGCAAPLVLKQAAGVGVEADDIAGQRHFGAGGARFERAGEGDDVEAAPLLHQRLLMIAGGVAGAIDERAE